MSDYVDVAVPLGVRKTFAYSVPSRFRNSIAPGMRVLVPFGRKLLTGYVVRTLRQVPPGNFKLRSVEQLLESESLIPAALVDTALWIADYYFTPPGEVLRALLPAGTQITGTQRISLTARTDALLRGGLKPGSLQHQEEKLLDILAREGPMTVKQLSDRSALRGAAGWIESLVAAQLVQVGVSLERPRVKAKEQLGIRLLPANEETVSKLTSRQKCLYFALNPNGQLLPLQEVLRSAGSAIGMARSLEKKGLVEIMPVKVQRLPIDLAEIQNPSNLILTSRQQDLLDQLLKKVLQRKAACCLLHGVTGSGKTEVYLRLIAEVLKLGETALFLVPEIGLTPLLSRLVVSRFPNQVSLLHSGMSPGERFDQWNRIRNGESRVVVGTRSAVFAPLEKLRLIVIDEEQDASYKQDESPCYQAHQVAWQRIHHSQGFLLLGSATPSIETYYSATQTADISYFSLPERIEAKPLPEIIVVDMSLEFQRHGKNTVVSHTLYQELKNCFSRGEQAMVLLNRRGYSRTLLCRSCGHVFVCPDCSVSMTYHQQEGLLVCHYCGQQKQIPSTCISCGGQYIYFLGVGTEQLESIVRSLLPDARIARLDRDTARQRGALRRILLSFAEHKLDILVGTQMLAKGHDFPNVTLVGVLAADAGLSFPDFRSAERTFQLLIQVSGRAGRGNTPGRVVIQSFYPDHYALRFARKQDYQSFFQQEIDFRKVMGYPPYCNLIQILITDRNAAKAARVAEKVAATLRLYSSEAKAASRLHILGPAAAPLEKLRGQYRLQVLVKSPVGVSVTPILHRAFNDLGRHKVPLKNIHVDVDPISLL